MGNPQHYSLELPSRCLQLVNELWPLVEKIPRHDAPDLGPLTSTFLISISFPMITIPVERIQRARNGGDEAYANDRELDKQVTAAFDAMLNGALKDAPFYVSGHWRFASESETLPINIADGVPEFISDKLNEEDAEAAASEMNASQWVSIIRNSLAHGGVAYLDNAGRSSFGTPVKMYAFVSGTYDQEGYKWPAPLKGLHFLRIGEDQYREFLNRWVGWLGDIGMHRGMSAA